MIIRDSRGLILKTVLVDFMGGPIAIESWHAPYIHTWRSIVYDCVRRDMVLIIQNFKLPEAA